MRVFASPLRFDANGDFWAPQTDDAELLAEVALLVMTRKRTKMLRGELAWDQDFGTLLEYLRHSRDTIDTTEVTAELQEAFRRYIGAGRVRVLSVTVSDGAMHIRLQYGAADNAATLTIPTGS